MVMGCIFIPVNEYNYIVNAPKGFYVLPEQSFRKELL